MSKAQRVVSGNVPSTGARRRGFTERGRPAELQIGVKKTPPESQALTRGCRSDGRIVVGDLGRELATYTPLPTLPSVWPG